MKYSVAILLIVAALTPSALGCLKDMGCFEHKLNAMVNGQINVEMTGHYTYLFMSQLFDQHTRHYPKVAKYFRAKAAEELSHAERFIQYQNQRGGTVVMDPVSRYVQNSCSDVDSVVKAFKCAMNLEAHVTRQLTQLHNDVSEITTKKGDCIGVAALEEDDLKLAQPMLLKCRTPSTEVEITSVYSNCDCDSIKYVSYVELAEMIAHEFLDHQVEDTKEIANHYRNIKKLNEADQGALGDYLFDKHLEL